MPETLGAEASGDPVTTLLVVAGGLACALLFGGMIMFSGVFARTAFAHLPEKTASAFMGAAFSTYYVAMTICAGAAAALLAWVRPADALVLAFVGVGFLVARQWLMPLARRLQEARERSEPGAAEQFGSVQGRSVLLYVFQTIAVIVVLVRLLMAGAA